MISATFDSRQSTIALLKPREDEIFRFLQILSILPVPQLCERLGRQGRRGGRVSVGVECGSYISRALCLAAKLDIADLLKDGSRHYRELADRTGTHAPSLNRVMRLLASVGVFSEEENGNFALTAVGEYFRTGVAESSRAMVMHFAGQRIQERWKDLDYCVQTGEPAFRLSGLTNIFEDPLRTPEEEAIFDAAMADLTRLIAVAVTSVYDFTPFRLLVDVGGGNGALMIGILKANPSLHGIVLDQPAAIDRAEKQIEDSASRNVARRLSWTSSKRCQRVLTLIF